jgi:hypothetical protein
MGKVEAIEQAVEDLSPDELDAFRRWFAEFDALAWDRQLDKDAAEGKLDELADEALKDHTARKSTDL